MKLPFQFQLRHLLLLCPFILLAPVWLAGKALYWGTPSSQFIPWWWQAWQTISSGEWPLWNPLLGMGAPLLANYQSALFYPLHWIYFGLAALGGLPLMAWGMAFIVSLHLAWAGWGMGLLVKRLGKSELAQTVAGLAFALSGYLVARAHFLSINAAVAWLPWILLAAYDLAQDPKRKRNLLMLAFFMGMQWLAGHAQIAWYSLLLAIAWAAFWAWRAGGWPQLARVAVNFATAGFGALALAAVQLIPTAEYLLNSPRATQVDFAAATTYSFWPWHLLTLLAPNIFGNPAYGTYQGYGNYWEDAIYIGLVPLFLAVFALMKMRRSKKEGPLVIFLAALIGVSLLLALGDNTPLFGWLYHHVPSFALFQAPARFSLWLVFALSLLAAFGVDAWRRPTGRALYWSRLAFAAAAAVLLQSLLAVALLLIGSIQGLGMLAWAALSLGVVATLAAWLNLRAPQTKGKGFQRWAWWLCLLLAADLLFAGWGLNPGADLNVYAPNLNAPALDTQQVGVGRLYLPEEDERLLKYERLFRFDTFFSRDPNLIRSTLLPNINLLDGIASINNYDPLVPARYRAWLTALETAPEGVQAEMLAAMSVTVVEQVSSGSAAEVSFMQRPALPRARWVNCALPISDAEEALEAVTSLAWSATDLVMVELHGAPGGHICGSGAAGTVELMASRANSVLLQVAAPGGGWLVLADTWYPGWRAYAGGRELPIYPAAGVFRAVHLEAGDYDVVFRYQPLSFSLGLVLSAFAWVGGGYLTWFHSKLR